MMSLRAAILFGMIVAGGRLESMAYQSATATVDPADKNAAQPAWTLDLSRMSVPDAPAAGKVHGQDFRPDRIQFENGILTFRQGQEFFADLEFNVFLFLTKGESIAGKSFRVNNNTEFGNPHVNVAWMPKEKFGAVPNTTTFMNKYAMILEFGPLQNGAIRGKIYLCVPDESKSFVAGTFTIAERTKTQVTQGQQIINPRSDRMIPSTPMEETSLNTGSPVFPKAEPNAGLMPSLVGLALYLFFTAGYWRVNSKAGLPGWGCLVPFYNLVLWMRCGGKPGWWAVWLFVPPISMVIYVIIAYEIARNFGKGVAFTVGLVFVPPIFAAILGFGKATYDPTLLRLRRRPARA